MPDILKSTLRNVVLQKSLNPEQTTLMEMMIQEPLFDECMGWEVFAEYYKVRAVYFIITRNLKRKLVDCKSIKLDAD